MFKTILVPTDGSVLSSKAIDAAVAFAAFAGSKIIGLSVAEPYPYSALAEGAMTFDANLYQEKMIQMAELHVQQIATAAKIAGVSCETVVGQSFSPSDEIVHVAEQKKCDVIFMASHGRKGLNRLFVGSETQKVLAHSPLPVVVYR